ncbi:MAG: VIT1/CCC1 transporter family protein [Thermoanaerobaculia bacterium]
MRSKSPASRFREHLQAETDSAFLYRTLSGLESRPELAQVFSRLAESEEAHARHWAKKLAESGPAPAPPRPSWRARTLARLARRFGPQLILPVLIDAEQEGGGAYRNEPAAQGTALAAEERSHNRLLKAMTGREIDGGLAGGVVAKLEGRHRAMGGNALRAAVLGANDGLVSNLSLVMGVAGAALDNHGILLTGLAGLLAGAISMALGEWLSVQSSRELYERQITIEKEELAADPEAEAQELALIYQSKGVPAAEAGALARRLIENRETALDTLAREELGIDPEELGGSAWEAALTSFVLFAVGAIVPVGPFFFATGQAAVALSLGLSGLGLFGIGAAITLMTGRGLWFSGLRQLGFGLAAAAVTYGIGWLMGVSLSG